MFLECNNHEAHGPTDYHAYATIANRQKQFQWTYVMYVLTSATDSFNIHTSLVWLDSSLSLRMHVNGNYNGNYHVCTHAIRMERKGSSHTRLHTHMSVHCGYIETCCQFCTCVGIGLKFHTTEGSHVVTVTVDTPCTMIHTPGLYTCIYTTMGLSLTPNTVSMKSTKVQTLGGTQSS